jgi:serine/threonine-protein kinase
MSALPTRLQSSLPRDIDDLVLRLLAADRTQRFQSAVRVRDEVRRLQSILAGPDEDTQTAEGPPWSRPGQLSFTMHRDFGSYRLLELKGAGSFAMVYMAEDRRTGRLVALKLLKPELSDSKDIIDRFRQEADIARRIQHPNVVRFYEFGVAERPGGQRDIYFTMEYIEGPRLKDLISAGQPLPLPRALDLAGQVAQGLHAAHQVGIIHRDLKPANILLDKAGKALIADFGIAVAHFLERRLTNPGQLMGTYAYMSPEQATGKEVTPASDLYSLGVILYEMLTGDIPVKDGPPLVMLRSIVEDEPTPFPSSLDIPPALKELTMQLLRKAPSERIQSAAELTGKLGRMRKESAASLPV